MVSSSNIQLDSIVTPNQSLRMPIAYSIAQAQIPPNRTAPNSSQRMSSNSLPSQNIRFPSTEQSSRRTSQGSVDSHSSNTSNAPNERANITTPNSSRTTPNSSRATPNALRTTPILPNNTTNLSTPSSNSSPSQSTVMSKFQTNGPTKIGKQIPSSHLLERSKVTPYHAPLPPGKLKFTSVKHYICRYCGEEYALSCSLLNHQRQQHYKIVYNCIPCTSKLVFYNRCSLLSHMFTHILNVTAKDKNEYAKYLKPLLHRIQVFTLYSTSDIENILTMPVYDTLEELMPGFNNSVKRKVSKKVNKKKRGKIRSACDIIDITDDDEGEETTSEKIDASVTEVIGRTPSASPQLMSSTHTSPHLSRSSRHSLESVTSVSELRHKDISQPNTSMDTSISNSLIEKSLQSIDRPLSVSPQPSTSQLVSSTPSITSISPVHSPVHQPSPVHSPERECIDPIHPPTPSPSSNKQSIISGSPSEALKVSLSFKKRRIGPKSKLAELRRSPDNEKQKIGPKSKLSDMRLLSPTVKLFQLPKALSTLTVPLLSDFVEERDEQLRKVLISNSSEKYPCHECSSSFASVKEHICSTAKKEMTTSPIVCHICNRILSSSCSLFAHQRSHSCQAPYVCPECGVKIEGDIDSFDKHMNQVCCHPHHHILVECHLCNQGSIFNNFDFFLIHYINSHCKVFHKCSLCAMAFKTLESLGSHRETTHSINIPSKAKLIYKCILCKKVFSQLKAMKAHLYIHLKTMVSKRFHMYVCPAGGCGYSSSQLEVFNSHLQMNHSNLKTLSKCYECSQSFEDMKSLMIHVKVKHPVQYKSSKWNIENSPGESLGNTALVSCKECNILFMTQYQFEKHCKTHNNKRLLEESLNEDDVTEPLSKKAKRDFDTESETSNVSSHIGLIAEPIVQINVEPTKKFKCGECEEMFGTISSLSQHQNDIHSIKPTLTCQQCGEVFHSRDDLKLHCVAIHSAPTKDLAAHPYVCWICAETKTHKAYAKSQLLEKHMISFHKQSKTTLDYHRIRTKVEAEEDIEPPKPVRQLKHVSSETYICAKCEFLTNEREEFKKHIVKHVYNEDGQQCQECGLCFSVLPTLKRHLFLVHKVRDFKQYETETGITIELPDEEVYSPIKASTSYHLHLNGDSDELASQKLVKELAASIHECNVCYKIFDDESSLRGHMRTHGMAFIYSKRRSMATATP